MVKEVIVPIFLETLVVEIDLLGKIMGIPLGIRITREISILGVIIHLVVKFIVASTTLINILNF